MVKKIVYLTIDDAPSKDMKEKVDYLVSRSIPAIWFCIGKNIEQRPKSIIYAIKQGFVIGNHSYNHRKFSDLSINECHEEIKKTDEIIEDIYKKAKVKRPGKFFRFPFGDRGNKNNKLQIQRFLKQSGYEQPKFLNIKYKWWEEFNPDKDRDVFWTYSLEEYKLLNLEKIYRRLKRKNPMRGGSLFSTSNEIMIIHDTEETTDLFFPIIDKLISKGIIFKLPTLKQQHL